MADLDRARDHLRKAIHHNRALAHWPAVAASRRRYAEVLRLRAGPGDEQEARSQLALALAEAESGPRHERTEGNAATCVRIGQSWRIDWGTRRVKVEASVGIGYLATLMGNPGQEIRSIDLVAGLDRISRARAGGPSAQPMLDRTAIQQYRQRLSALKTEIDEYEADGDGERASRARVELDWILNELSAATGLGGLTRRFPDNSERARTAVGKAIRRILARVTALDPHLGDHLRQSVRTGVVCSYRPA